jgi:hypothetical protein
MNRNRLLFSAAMVLSLLILFAWQQSRGAQITACHDKGGIWTGATCRPEPGRIIIQRDLRRS